VSLRNAWEAQAGNWVRWARAPGHDSYWQHHRPPFLELVPAPGRLTLDVGCGEGRVTRDLRALGHEAVGIDSAPSMIAAAREVDPESEYVEAGAEALPFEDGAADLVVAFMSLMDIDEMPRAVREVGRVLEVGGRMLPRSSTRSTRPGDSFRGKGTTTRRS
jgi:ubiquinone/menaquinone biosynthesis C-methylase UbiE